MGSRRNRLSIVRIAMQLAASASLVADCPSPRELLDLLLQFTKVRAPSSRRTTYEKPGVDPPGFRLCLGVLWESGGEPR